MKYNFENNVYYCIERDCIITHAIWTNCFDCSEDNDPTDDSCCKSKIEVDKFLPEKYSPEEFQNEMKKFVNRIRENKLKRILC